jgi:hypothetical protein
MWSVFGERHRTGAADPRNWYTGTFSVRPRAHEVVHHVRYSSIAGYEGADLVRHYRRHGDRLVLSFPVSPTNTAYARWMLVH